jgi:prolipoprotein diacylglyceryl transferase
VSPTLASIPSPTSGVFHVGSFAVHAYGLTLLVAILVCVWLTQRRWAAGRGDPELVLRLAVWAVAAGIVGARAYHDITSWNEVPDPKWKGIFEVWNGGLGIWGGILAGTLVGAWIVRRAGASAFAMMDAAAPGILLAQGIGRIGNYWNQELFGKPTSLPWGLEIDLAHRPAAYLNRATFHPTFLYELIWDVAGVALLLYLDRRVRFRPPALFAAYVSWYTFGRFFEELLRVDPAHRFGGLRLNAWVSIAVWLASTWVLVRLQRERTDRDAPPRRPRIPRRKQRAQPPPPAMAIPKGRVRHRQ